LPGSLSLRERLSDLAELAKLRISLLVLFVTGAGYCLGAPRPIGPAGLLHALFGTALVAVAANILNQVMERRWDRLMRRTTDRPIAAGRVDARAAAAVSVGLAGLGVAYLALAANLLAAALAATTLILYLFAYTPLKRVTEHNTLVGAVPGALPPLIGYAAAAGTIDEAAGWLFAILFVWQIPHFYAIAWLYREDYRRAGYRMLSAADETGSSTARQTVAYSVALLAVSFGPLVAGKAGPVFAVMACALGVMMFAAAARFAISLSRAGARHVVLASVIYLPALISAWLFASYRG
jgi:protoheme IX farnesyltransferase